MEEKKALFVTFMIRYADKSVRKFAVACSDETERDIIMKDVYSIDGISYLKKSSRCGNGRKCISFDEYIGGSWANWLCW